MIIEIGNLTLSSEACGQKITYIVIQKDGIELEKIESQELTIAIKALEDSCWRP